MLSIVIAHTYRSGKTCDSTLRILGVLFFFFFFWMWGNSHKNSDLHQVFFMTLFSSKEKFKRIIEREVKKKKKKYQVTAIANLFYVLLIEIEPGLGIKDLLDCQNFWDLVHEARLDAHLQSHHRARARPASPLQLQHHDEAVNLVEGHIPSIRHQARPNLFQNHLNIIFGQRQDTHRRAPSYSNHRNPSHQRIIYHHPNKPNNSLPVALLLLLPRCRLNWKERLRSVWPLLCFQVHPKQERMIISRTIWGCLTLISPSDGRKETSIYVRIYWHIMKPGKRSTFGRVKWEVEMRRDGGGNGLIAADELSPCRWVDDRNPIYLSIVLFFSSSPPISSLFVLVYNPLIGERDTRWRRRG